MKAHRLLTALAAILITAGQALIFAVDTASTARLTTPVAACAALHKAAWRQV